MNDVVLVHGPRHRSARRTMVRARMHVLSISIGALLAVDAASARSDGLSVRGLPPRHYVTSCEDNGLGTLRETLANASSGDAIDLSLLTCNTIFLTTGELRTYLDDIDFSGSVTISAGGKSRVLSHLGEGTIGIYGLTIADGMHSEDWITAGGCIYTLGSVFAIGATITNCTAASRAGTWGMVLGGGIFANGTAHLLSTRIVDNTILSKNEHDIARGGGIHTAQLQMRNSTISGNVIEGTAPKASTIKAGGGFYSYGNVLVSYSTISGNFADFGGGGHQSAGLPDESNGLVSTISNSTISGNEARLGAGGIISSDDLLSVRNSTIAFNLSGPATDVIPACGGILFRGGDGYLSLRSSIVSNNVADGIAADVCTTAYTAPIIGYDNLIVAANRPLPVGTIQSDPLLEPLAYNGGQTMTHGLPSTSPAIDAGNNSTWLSYDQRGRSRVVGEHADIGAFERQPDLIFADSFD